MGSSGVFERRAGPALCKQNMQLFGLHTNPQKSAELLCDTHVISQARETIQILSTALWLRGYELTGEIDCSEYGCGVRQPYKLFGKHHPIVWWCASSRAHFEWTRRHGDALMAEYTHRTGDKVHMCQLFLDHLKEHTATHGLPDGMPQNECPNVFIQRVEDELGKKRAGEWLPRIAVKNPPEGCAWGMVAVDSSPVPNDWVASYKDNYLHKRSVWEGKNRKMTWSAFGQLGGKKRTRE